MGAQATYHTLPDTFEGPTMEKARVSATGSLVTIAVSFRSAENLHVHGTASCENALAWGIQEKRMMMKVLDS